MDLDKRLNGLGSADLPPGFADRMEAFGADIASGSLRPAAGAPLGAGLFAVAAAALLGVAGGDLSPASAAPDLRPEVALAPSTLLDAR